MKFAFVGGLGFVVDVLSFSLFFYLLNLDLMLARCLAFFCAANCTWLGNRYFTFAAQQSSHIAWEWLRFMLVACVSALPNFLMFKLSLWLFGDVGVLIYLALVLGIFAGLLSNYYFSRYWVFSK